MEETHRRPWPHCLIKNIKMNYRNYVVNLKCAQSTKTNLERPSWISFGVGLIGYRHLVAFFTFRENHAANHKQTILLNKNILTTHYNTETGKIAMKCWNMKMLDVKPCSMCIFIPYPQFLVPTRKKVMTMPVRWKVEYEDVTTLYVKGSTEAAQTTLVSTNLYLPYNHLYPLQDGFL